MLAKISAGVNNLFNLEAIIIDSRFIFNLILRLVTAEHYLYKIDNLLPELQCLDGHFLYFY